MNWTYRTLYRDPVSKYTTTTSILDSKRRIFANKENIGKENSLQRKILAINP